MRRRSSVGRDDPNAWECPICYEEDEDRVSLLPCGHVIGGTAFLLV